MSQNREVKATNISALESNVASLDTRVDFLESGIDANNLITDAEKKFAKIVAGGDDNIAKFWKVRHHAMMSSIGNGANPEAADFEQIKSNDRFMSDPNFNIASTMVSNAQAYLANAYLIEQNEQMQFRIKKGENFFWIGIYLAVANATVFRVYVDGVNVNTVGLVDELGVTVPSSFSASAATTQYGKNFQFYGLDGEEHIITIKNENATALEVPLQYIDVGFRPNDYALDHTMSISAGAASVNEVTTSFNESTFTFSRPGEGLANGYTGMVKIDQAGTLTAVDGLSPASTQVKPQSTLAFSSGPVTTLPVKNNFAFPTNGICLYTSANGETFPFSYSGKSDPSPANQSLDGVIWQRQPVADYTPLVRPTGTKRISTITNTNAGNSANFDVVGAARKITIWQARPLIGHYFWINVVGGANVQFDPGGASTVTEGHKVDILTTDSANDVATKIRNAIAAVSEHFTATVLTNVVTVTNTQDGAVTATSTTATGVTVATPTAGVNPTYAVNSWRGDARIEYWAKAPIQITNSNNKVDFQITVNGTTTSHTATLANGYYSADLIPLEKAFVDAMNAAKSIRGNYFLKYNKDSQFWTIGVSGDEQTEIRFLFSTGANAANSLKTVIGFTADLTGKRSYLSLLPKQHTAQRVYQPDSSFRPTEHPSIKYSWALSAQVTIAEADQLLVDLGLPSYRRQASAGNIFYIYPDDDACGMTLTFMREDVSVYITYQIDDQDITYLAQMDRPADTASPTKGTAVSCFISFPKGSRKIAIRPEANTWFQMESTTTYMTFFGYRQWFTKPPWETLTLTEKVLRCVEVNPIRLFGTNYGHHTDVYVPTTNDNLNTIVESGTKEITNVLVNQAGAFFDVVGAAKNFRAYAAPFQTAGGEIHYFWYKVTNGVNVQTDPAPGGTGHQVDILLADTAVQIAAKTAAVVNAVTDKFTAEVRNTAGATFTIRNVYDGNVTAAVNGTLTAGHTFTIENTGTSHWVQTSSTAIFTARYRAGATYGSSYEVSFTLQGDGGGIGIMHFDSTATSQAYCAYLTNGSNINEATDLIEVGSADAAATLYDMFRFMHLGLKAGTYKLRIKNDHTQALINQTVFVVDTVAPQVATVHADITNSGQGLAYPLNVKRRNFQRYGINRQPSWLMEGLARTGLVNMTDYLVNTHTLLNYDDASTVSLNHTSQYWNSMDAALTGSYYALPFIGRSCAIYYNTHTAFTPTITPSIDGVASSNITLRENVKGGTTVSATKNVGAASRLFVKDLEFACSFNASLTYNCTNTQGIRAHQKAILIDNSGNREEVFIASFVTNTSFTIKKALAVLTPANIVKIQFHGFHVVKGTCNDADNHHITGMEYEPLPLEWSILEERVSTNTFQEIKELNYSISVPATSFIGFEYPFHSDGEQGTPLTSEIEFLRFNTSLTLNRGLKIISNSSASPITALLNVRSRRNIAFKASGMVRG